MQLKGKMHQNYRPYAQRFLLFFLQNGKETSKIPISIFLFLWSVCILPLCTPYAYVRNLGVQPKGEMTAASIPRLWYSGLHVQ